MDKPITVARQEFMDALVNLVNGSELPAFVITPLLELVTKKVAALEEQQYQHDLKAWNKQNETE